MRGAALVFGCMAAIAGLPAVPAAAQMSETPSAALARHMRVLATKPKDFYALIGAGKAALELGDTQSAAGFFGRAEEAWPSSPMPQIGMGAALAREDDATAALSFFARAEQLGAKPISFGVERGLAYDLLGRHTEAQADYQLALSGTDANEARRRLALSLAITGKKDEALTMLGPLMARGDAAAARCRALVLALNGDAESARRSLDAAMPGSGSYMVPFFAKLPGLRSDQKAAAVHLGIFPDSGQSYAATNVPQFSPPPVSPVPKPQQQQSPEDRLLSVEQLLRSNELTNSPKPQVGPVQIANVPRATRQQIASVPTPSRANQLAATPKQRVWLQLASGTNAEALPGQFRRLKSRNRDLFDGISGYVADEGVRARLLIGPFKTAEDAKVFAEDLASAHIEAFSWISQPGQMIRKLPAE